MEGIRVFGFDRYALVFHFGDNSSDVAILRVGCEEGVVEVLGTSETLTRTVRGKDIDNRMVAYVCEVLRREHGQDVRESNSDISLLLSACQKVKEELCSKTQTELVVESLKFKMTFTRARFEALNDDLFRQVLVPVDEALRIANMTKSQIREVLLVGGCSQIPKVKELLKKYFVGGVDLHSSLNPGACGSALEAASKLSNKPALKRPDVVLLARRLEEIKGEDNEAANGPDGEN